MLLVTFDRFPTRMYHDGRSTLLALVETILLLQVVTRNLGDFLKLPPDSELARAFCLPFRFWLVSPLHDLSIVGGPHGPYSWTLLVDLARGPCGILDFLVFYSKPHLSLFHEGFTENAHLWPRHGRLLYSYDIVLHSLMSPTSLSTFWITAV